MSWVAGSFVVLALALGGGFAWYERSHPRTEVLALVATLAGLAAVGRIAFAAVPNVKPTTDIVIIAGFALGPAPGFAVGAVAALASNVFFGQGSWTPWEMVAWGICGLAGAGLRPLLGGRPRRLPLALLCGLLGMVYGAIMDFSIWVLTAQHGLGQYLAVSASSLPFNVAHAVGNVVFCLAFGPGLVTALLRFRARLDARFIPTPGETPA